MTSYIFMTPSFTITLLVKIFHSSSHTIGDPSSTGRDVINGRLPARFVVLPRSILNQEFLPLRVCKEGLGVLLKLLSAWIWGLPVSNKICRQQNKKGIFFCFLFRWYFVLCLRNVKVKVFLKCDNFTRQVRFENEIASFKGLLVALSSYFNTGTVTLLCGEDLKRETDLILFSAECVHLFCIVYEIFSRKKSGFVLDGNFCTLLSLFNGTF